MNPLVWVRFNFLKALVLLSSRNAFKLFDPVDWKFWNISRVEWSSWNIITKLVAYFPQAERVQMSCLRPMNLNSKYIKKKSQL